MLLLPLSSAWANLKTKEIEPYETPQEDHKAKTKQKNVLKAITMAEKRLARLQEEGWSSGHLGAFCCRRRLLLLLNSPSPFAF